MLNLKQYLTHLMHSLWPTMIALKALCHAIRADYLLIEAAHTHAVNEQWAWRRTDKLNGTDKCFRFGGMPQNGNITVFMPSTVCTFF